MPIDQAVEVVKNALEEKFCARRQCPCLVLVWANSDTEADSLLRLHVTLFHPEVKKAIEKYLNGERLVT